MPKISRTSIILVAITAAMICAALYILLAK
jgi:hypothetical protein